ncbi:PREDICTED: seven in absentia homolog 3 [Tauraco erythrolophus]|uniref:seven in absentia homolog 3 n=1 Tax=Tauraco erythrolophus TaxID=121530 RepID=UPI0005237167|nr:PREDICTED: seven in absentia homolog 3 [Tauraco erythrolophus]
MLFFTQCFGAVLDLIHLRFQHYKAKRVFSAAGQLVCVVNPTHSLKVSKSRRGVDRSSPKYDSFHNHHQAHHHCHQAHNHPLNSHMHPHHLHFREAPYDGDSLSPLPPCPCTCPLFSCPWEGHLEVVVSHLRQTHRINILQGAEIVFLATDMHLPAPTDWIIMHSCLGHQFLLVLRKQEKYEGHPQFFATMMLIGTPTQADNFTYRLELNRNQRRLKWEATPRSVLECVDSVISDGDCLVLNTSLAQLFSDNGSLAIGIAITTSKVHNTEAEM